MSDRVIFRQDKEDGVIVACFPDFPANPGCCVCYEHIGQHGEAAWEYIRKRTKPVKRRQYARLLKELRSIGYDDLAVRVGFTRERRVGGNG